MDQISKQLTRQDREDYFFNLGLIQRSEDHVLAWIKSVSTIKERKLYLWEHATWEEFCDDKLKKSRSYVHRLIEAEGVRKALPPPEPTQTGAEPNVANSNENTPDSHPLRESHARELARLPVEQRAEALADATKAAGKKPPTADQIKAEVDRRAADEPEPVTDARGSPVTQKKLQPVFVAGVAFGTLASQVATLKGKVAALLEGPAGAVLAEQRQDVERDRQNILAALKFSRPYTVCPYCDARKKDCEACRGRGWVTKHVHDQAPAKAQT